MRLVGLVVLLAAFAVATPAQAAISNCHASQISQQPGAGGPALFFLSCEGIEGSPAYTVKTPPAHGAVSDVNDENGSGQHGGLWHMTYTADDDAWGLHDSWVMHADDGVDPDGADFSVSITMAAAPYCQELVDGTPKPLPTWTVEAGHSLDAQLVCSYGGSDDVTSLSVEQQAKHGLAWVQSTDGGPSAPRLRYKPAKGFHGTDHFTLALAVGTGSSHVPVTVKVTRDRTAPVVTLVRPPKIAKRAVIFKASCSERCRVTVRVTGKHVHAHGARTFSGSRAIRVPVRVGKRRLHYVLVARDRAGNRSTAHHGTLKR
jgi:hypothetical protein